VGSNPTLSAIIKSTKERLAIFGIVRNLFRVAVVCYGLLTTVVCADVHEVAAAVQKHSTARVRRGVDAFS
jgi:hypothetical protein